MRKLKLPYNKIGYLLSYFIIYQSLLTLDDPYIAAEEFLTANDLPVWYLDQVCMRERERERVYKVSLYNIPIV